MRHTIGTSLAPVLLCAVALAQLCLAHILPLSPWKGGGFGMFSTVDSPSARFVRLYLITASEEIPVMTPKALRSDVGVLQTLPDENRLHRVATQLAGMTWVDYRLESALRHYRELFGDLALLPGGRSAGFHTAEAATELGQSLQPEEGFVDLGPFHLVRALDEGEPPPPSARAVAFVRVRAELWRYRFDPGLPGLKAAKLLETTVEPSH